MIRAQRSMNWGHHVVVSHEPPGGWMRDLWCRSNNSRDDSRGDLDNLPEPDDIAQEIVENLESGLESFRSVLAELER